MSAARKAIVETINEDMRRGDTEAFLRRVPEDFVWTMVGEPPIRGKEAIRQWMAGVGPQDPPDFTVRTVVADGDVVAAMGDMTMPEDGAPVSYAFCDVWRFRGDTPVSLDAYVIKTGGAERAKAAGARP